MVDIETDLSTLYVMSDDFCKWHLPAEAPQVGPQASLRRWKVQEQIGIVTPPHQTSKQERWPKARLC